MSIFEYDEEKEMKLIRQDERDIGIEVGIERGMEERINHGIQIFVQDNLEEQARKLIDSYSR